MIILGDGPLKKEIKEKTKKENLDDVIKILGIQKNINDYLQAIDIFAFPSLYEGLGMAAIEAQTSGLNCILSEKIPKEVKINENVFFLDINSEEEWKNKIIEMSNNYDRNININKIKEAGYDIKTEAIKLEKMYINLYEEK